MVVSPSRAPVFFPAMPVRASALLACHEGARNSAHRLRSASTVVIQRPFGRARVMAFTTALGPFWSRGATTLAARSVSWLLALAETARNASARVGDGSGVTPPALYGLGTVRKLAGARAQYPPTRLDSPGAGGSRAWLRRFGVRSLQQRRPRAL